MKKGSTLTLWLGTMFILLAGLFVTVMVLSPDLGSQVTGAFIGP
jgi:hypothetical protein